MRRRPHKVSSLPDLYTELEISLEANCSSVMDAAEVELGVTTLPLITGITSLKDLWTILYKYKMVCPSLESRLTFLTVLTDFCCGCVANSAICDLFLDKSIPRIPYNLFEKLSEEWSHVFQAIYSLPQAKRLEEHKMKALHSTFTRWGEIIDSSLMNKLNSMASDFCFKNYGLTPVKGRESKKVMYTFADYEDLSIKRKVETGQVPVQLQVKFDLKRLNVGSHQLEMVKNKRLRLYIGTEIVLGIQPMDSHEICLALKREHLDGVVVCLGDGDSFCDVKDVVFLYPNSLGCAVIQEALDVLPGFASPPLYLSQGEDRRIVAQFRRRLKEGDSENVIALLKLLVGKNVVEVGQEFSEALMVKREKASRLFSRSYKKAPKLVKGEKQLVANKNTNILKDVPTGYQNAATGPEELAMKKFQKAREQMEKRTNVRPGFKYRAELLKPSCHLVKASYKSFQSHVQSFDGWEVKRRKTTGEEKKLYFVDVVFNVPNVETAKGSMEETERIDKEDKLPKVIRKEEQQLVVSNKNTNILKDITGEYQNTNYANIAENFATATGLKKMAKIKEDQQLANNKNTNILKNIINEYQNTNIAQNSFVATDGEELTIKESKYYITEGYKKANFAKFAEKSAAATGREELALMKFKEAREQMEKRTDVRPGSKYFVELLKPSCHLVRASYTSFRKHVHSVQGWEVKRRKATEEEKQQYKKRKGELYYFVDVVFTVPKVETNKKRSMEEAEGTSNAGKLQKITSFFEAKLSKVSVKEKEGKSEAGSGDMSSGKDGDTPEDDGESTLYPRGSF